MDLAGNQAEFCVNFIITESVNDGTSCFFEHGCVVDVVLFIKTSAQFQNTEDFLSFFRSMSKGGSDLTVICKSIQRNLDGKDAWIICCFIEKIHKWLCAVEWKTQEQIMVLQIVDSTTAIAVCKINRYKWFGFMIVPLFFILVWIKCRRECKTKGKIQRNGANQNTVRRNFQLFTKESG